MDNITGTTNSCINLNMKNNVEKNTIVKVGEEFTLNCKANRTLDIL